MLKNKVAIITGGTRGIGLETARLFKENNAEVIIFGSKKESVDTAISELSKEGLSVNGYYPNLSNYEEIEKVIKEINDKYGVIEGDKQIQAAANALIKTQLDNSDLMRSDGNEFVIYTVGYSQKQIVNYIHKLNKELKRMPYNYGAEFGYSVIQNNLKTVEDALNEAIEDMKNKKASVKE